MREKDLLAIAILGLLIGTLGIGLGIFSSSKFKSYDTISDVKGNTGIHTTGTSIVLMNETFTSTPLGNLPSGWVDISVGVASCTVVDFGGNKVLMADDVNGETLASVNYYPNHSLTRGVLEYRLRFTDEYSRLFIKNSTGATIWHIFSDTGGHLRYLDGGFQDTGYFMSDSTWYDLKVVFDITIGLEVYVNTVLRINMSGSELPSGGAVCWFNFVSIWSTPSDLYIDNVTLSGNPSDDFDLDGLTNLGEYLNGTNPNNPDTDGDGLNDGAEILIYLTNATNPDTDGDGLTDGLEINLHDTDPLDPDSDDDLIPDAWEVSHDLYPLNPLDASLDLDGDGFTTVQEYTYNTDPHDYDTDNDGYSDWEEILAGTDPLNPTSMPSPLDQEVPLLEISILIVGIALAAALVVHAILMRPRPMATPPPKSTSPAPKKPGKGI